MKVKRAPLKNGKSEKREFLKIYKKKLVVMETIIKIDNIVKIKMYDIPIL